MSVFTDQSENVVGIGASKLSSESVDHLVSRAINGEFEAFDQIMLLYRERLYGVIYNMTFNHEDDADITQEAIVKAFR